MAGAEKWWREVEAPLPVFYYPWGSAQMPVAGLLSRWLAYAAADSAAAVHAALCGVAPRAFAVIPVRGVRRSCVATSTLISRSAYRRGCAG